MGSTKPKRHTAHHIPRQNLRSYSDTPTHHIPRLAHLIDGFLLSSSLEGKASDTIAGYRIKLGRFLGFVGDRPIADISSAEIRQYPDHAKQAYGLSLASVKRHKVALQALYLWTVDKGFIEVNPMSKVKVAKPETNLVQSLNIDQIRNLLNSFNGRGIEATATRQLL